MQMNAVYEFTNINYIVSKLITPSLFFLPQTGFSWFQDSVSNWQNCPDTSMYGKYLSWQRFHLFWGKQPFQSALNDLTIATRFIVNAAKKKTAFVFSAFLLATDIVKLCLLQVSGL